MRIVIDTNVLIDGGAGFFGPARQVLDLCLQNKVTPILSQEITDENWHIIEKLIKDEKYLKDLENYFSQAEIIEPLPYVGGYLEDPDDEKFLEAALAAEAEAVVTSDNHLLSVVNYHGVPVMKPQDFLYWYKEKLPQNNLEWYDQAKKWFGV